MSTGTSRGTSSPERTTAPRRPALAVGAGVGSPFFVGAVYDATGSFVVPLVIVGVIAVVGALAYLLLIRRVGPLPVIRPRTA